MDPKLHEFATAITTSDTHKQNKWFDAVHDLAEERLSSAQLKISLAGAIDQMPGRDAMVLQLLFIDKLNIAEIGAVLDIGAAQAEHIKNLALVKLRNLLSDML